MYTMKGILDRFEGNQAVILIEETKEELIVNKEVLPRGSMKNTIFNLKKESDGYTIVNIDLAQTKAAERKSSSLMDQLRAKNKGSKFKQ
ncbi:hypothetical protein GCM10007971_06300 [Oceanobacillus indicireducens]|uniref:DUF3006 domain-containing protein n=1 Tax=Oceanobacillus indicireducens TaxID=1004261 RepID=A0A917XS90_9BACI|nr:hypothetical protein GCM10007971_06300 [Oceanobacillus indicireducens]